MTEQELEKLALYRQHVDPSSGLVRFSLEDTSTMVTLTFCTLLARSKKTEDMALLANALKGFFRTQITDPEDENYGWIPLRIGASYRDKNAALFFLPLLIEISKCDSLDESTRALLDDGIRRLFTSAERRWHEEIFDVHRDFKNYTNVFLLYIQALLLGATYLNLPRWERRARSEWKRWFHHVAYHGIDEFISTLYHEINHETLTRLRDLFPDETTRQQVGRVLEHLEAVQRAIEHPRLRLPVCGSSRDYRRFLRPGTGRFKPFAGVAPDEGRTFPYEAEGRAGTVPFRFKSWQESHCGLGTMTGGYYFWQNISGFVVVGENETRRETAFIPGTFSTIPGFVDHQGSRALFVFARSPTSLYRTQIPLPDNRIAEEMGPFGVGLTTGWASVADHSGRLHLAAYGHELFLDAFALEDNQCVPVPLEKIRRPAGETIRLGCSFEADVDEYVFPGHLSWFGLVLELRKTSPNAPEIPRIEWEHAGSRRRFRSGDLEVQLFEHPTGEQVQLYREDWRTLPLFHSPDHVLWPGQWLQGGSDLSAFP